MEMQGQVEISAPRARVWAALNDPDMLARCIEGVESLTRVADPATGNDRLEGKMNAKVGPVRASFTGHVMLTNVVEPESYVLVGEGKGGVAGFAKGEAAVTLAETAPNQTQLSYRVTSSVGGKLAQLGARLIEGTAKGYADSFFGRLKAEIEVPEAAAPAVGARPDAPADAIASTGLTGPATGLSPQIWGAGLVLAVVVFLIWQWGLNGL
jgi:carbon monoxide dehydrogenase subunit G